MAERVRLEDPPGPRRSTKGKKKRTRLRGTLHHRSKLDAELIADLCDLLEEGLPLDGCCDYLGISTTAFLEWRRKGELYGRQPKVPKEYRLYVRLWLKTRRAHAIYRLERQRRLNDPKNRDWVRDLAILERRDRLNYGKKEPEGGGMEDFDPDERFL